MEKYILNEDKIIEISDIIVDSLSSLICNSKIISLDVKFISDLINKNSDQYQELNYLINTMKNANDFTSLHDIHSLLLGKNGSIANHFKNLGKLDKDQKIYKSIALNFIKDVINESYYSCRDQLMVNDNIKFIDSQNIDITIPSSIESKGKSHLINDSIFNLHNILGNSGYEYAHGNQIDLEKYNFSALNISDDHPARNDHDTFYLNNKTLLRSHTSNAQIHYLEKIASLNDENLNKFKFYTIGKVYRRDSDATHSPMFHQIEGFCAYPGITFNSLFKDIKCILNVYFNANLIMRARPSYFPFTEPSFEVDISAIVSEDGVISPNTTNDPNAPNSRWIEVLGCGMVHNNVFENCNLKPIDAYAFGMGIERLACFKDGSIKNINCFFN